MPAGDQSSSIFGTAFAPVLHFFWPFIVVINVAFFGCDFLGVANLIGTLITFVKATGQLEKHQKFGENLTVRSTVEFNPNNGFEADTGADSDLLIICLVAEFSLKLKALTSLGNKKSRAVKSKQGEYVHGLRYIFPLAYFSFPMFRIVTGIATFACPDSSG